MPFESAPKVPLRGLPVTTPEGSTPTPEKDAFGQYRDYWVLPETERAKGFVRPLRHAYKHVGERPVYATRPLTPEEKERYAEYGYVCFEEYPEDSHILGTYWTAARLESGCGTFTSMGDALAETYARDPTFYGSTFCCHCRQHFAVREFVWTSDNERVGS